MRSVAITLLLCSACAHAPLEVSSPPTVAPSPLPADTLSLLPLEGPFSSLDDWCRHQPAELRCDRLERPVGQATIVPVEGPGRASRLVVGMQGTAGWYAGLAPDCTDGHGCPSGRLEQQSPPGGPPVYLFRYEPELGQNLKVEWLLVCIGGAMPACTASVIPLRARGVGDGDSSLALHVAVSFGQVFYSDGKLAFAVHTERREVAGVSADAVEWRRRLARLGGPHLLPLPR